MSFFDFQGLSINVVDKIYLKFSHAWWDENCDGFSILRGLSIQNNDIITSQVIYLPHIYTAKH